MASRKASRDQASDRARIGMIIHRCRFNGRDMMFGTEGQCGSFALALAAVLDAHGIPSRLRVAALTRSRTPDGSHHWNHVFVEAAGAFWDIRGRVDAEAIRREFGRHLMRTSADRLLRDIAALKASAQSMYEYRDRRLSWLRRLSRSGSAAVAGQRAGLTAQRP